MVHRETQAISELTRQEVVDRILLDKDSAFSGRGGTTE